MAIRVQKIRVIRVIRIQKTLVKSVFKNPPHFRYFKGPSPSYVQYMYNTCTIFVRLQLYKYCTTIVHILYNDQCWYGPDSDVKRRIMRQCGWQKYDKMSVFMTWQTFGTLLDGINVSFEK